MADATIDYEKSEDELTLILRGRLDRTTVNALWRDSKGWVGKSPVGRVAVDLEGVSSLDSSGAAFLWSIESLCQEKGLGYEERNIPENLQEFLEYIGEKGGRHLEEELPPAFPGAITWIGLKVREKTEKTHGVIDFFGRFLIASAGRIRHPAKFHVLEIFYQLQVAGVRAVPLVAALSFLLGILIVFQGSSNLQSFGASIYVADMVVLAVTREMAPLVVAVAIAGRSGSAFAAEIGTMKVNEELDALTVMNLDVISLIVLPRVLALAVAEPILTAIADAVGILGGVVTARLHLGVPPLAFLNEARDTLSAADLFTGMLKGFTSGIFTGLIACASGLRTGTESGSVGIQTTSAAVKSIFAVIVIDTVYSYIFLIYGW